MNQCFTVESPLEDFSFNLIEAIKFQNWYYNNYQMTYQLYSDSKKIYGIPVGTIDFILKYFKDKYGYVVEPIRIDLFEKSLNRSVRYLLGSEVQTIDKKVFVKEHTFKGYIDILHPTSEDNSGLIHNKLYQVSNVVNFDSEFRIFVHNKRIVGVKHYSGDHWDIVDRTIVEDMLAEILSHTTLTTFSFDVAKNKNTHFLIEVHEFFATGLYGFSDHSILPQMFIRGIQQIECRCDKG